MKRHAGFTTFTITLLLILILLGISLLVGKLMVADRRVSLNEVQYRQALALAELGLADGAGRLAQDASWRTVSSGVTVSVSAGSYTLLASDEGAVPVGGTTVIPVRLRAQATLADNSANAVAEVQTIKVSVLAGTPAAPLTVAGGMNIGGTFSAVANPNGGGLGVPLSVWSDESVDGHGSWQTCHKGDYSSGCVENLSDKSNIGADIKDNDPDFPSDLLWYLFNQRDTQEGWDNIRAMAIQILNNCSSLGAGSKGLIIVENAAGGKCDIPALVGSESAPVVLIIKDSDFAMNGGAVFNGIIFDYASNPASPADAKINGTATVNGALVANFPFKLTSGTFNAVYDQNVLQNIANGAAFQRINLVPGSWRDW
ncbi:PilX N-terminal domain-containing pilus assembly protein [Aeromonas veronii]|uniref:PilX N-terminal domain-containing pilus assembly protein n=1 Tax=Aeromonas veronii TaxID=654 RepID=UPI0038EB7322